MGDEDKPKTKLEKTNILCIITSIVSEVSEVILDLLFRIHSFFAIGPKFEQWRHTLFIPVLVVFPYFEIKISYTRCLLLQTHIGNDEWK